MTYLAGEALWLTRLQGMSQFDADNSSRGKWGMLNSGASDHYAILKPGANNRDKLGSNTRRDQYRTIIQLWQRYVDDGTSLTNLETLVDNVLAELDTYWKMGDSTGGVIRANIVEVREYVQIPGDAPKWILAELVGEWHEQTSITYAE